MVGITWTLSSVVMLRSYSRKTGSTSLEIADDSSGDYVKKVLPNGRVVMVADLENLARSQLRINTRL
jgi:hypothetical protein